MNLEGGILLSMPSSDLSSAHGDIAVQSGASSQQFMQRSAGISRLSTLSRGTDDHVVSSVFSQKEVHEADVETRASSASVKQ